MASALEESVLPEEMLVEVAKRCSPLTLYSLSSSCRLFSSSLPLLSQDPFFPNWEVIVLEAAANGYLGFLRYWHEKEEKEEVKKTEEKEEKEEVKKNEEVKELEEVKEVKEEVKMGVTFALNDDLTVKVAQMAALKGQREIFTYLLLHSPRFSSGRGSTFLLHAIFGKHIDFSRFLISKGFMLSPLATEVAAARITDNPEFLQEIEEVYAKQSYFELGAYCTLYATVKKPKQIEKPNAEIERGEEEKVMEQPPEKEEEKEEKEKEKKQEDDFQGRLLDEQVRNPLTPIPPLFILIIHALILSDLVRTLT